MKVQSAELKLHLGRYLRDVEKSGRALEVCVRERTVAYLVPTPAAAAEGNATSQKLLAEQLRRGGLKLVRPATLDSAPLKEPVLAGDGRSDVSTVEKMRAERDW